MHLSAINNTISTNETYTVSFNNSATPTAALTLKDPFAANSYGSLYDLTSIAMPNSSLTYSFNYDGATGNAVAGAAQLSLVTFPFSGTLGWSYSSTQYTGLSPRYQDEVTSRTMNPGSGSQSYSFARTFGSGPTPVHNQTTLTDPHGDSEVWAFFTTQTAGPSSAGLVSSVQRNSAAGGTPSSSALTWSADVASNAYVSAVAVGTSIATRPPHRSVRAELPHTAPPLDTSVETNIGIRMKSAGTRNPSFEDRP